MDIFGFDPGKAFDFENGYHLTSEPKRLGKLLAHYEIYKRQIGIPGHVVEFGVFKGASLIRWATFRRLLENDHSRKVIGFDIFGQFPTHAHSEDKKFIQKFESEAGHGIPLDDLQKSLSLKRIENVELIPGDIRETISYFSAHPEVRISLLHIDVDTYETTKIILENIYSRVVPGGLVVLDDYGTVEGETRALEEFFGNRLPRLEKVSFSHIPAFFVKSG